MIKQASRSFSAEKTSIDRYSTQCSTTFNSSPVVPDLTCIVAPNAAHLSLDSALLSIGGKFFFCNEGGSQDLEFAELKGFAFAEFWEDGSCREDFIVLCRRRIPRPRLESNEDERSEARREEAMRQRISVFQNRSRSRSKARRPGKLPHRFQSFADYAAIRGGRPMSVKGKDRFLMTENSSEDSEETRFPKKQTVSVPKTCQTSRQPKTPESRAQPTPKNHPTKRSVAMGPTIQNRDQPVTCSQSRMTTMQTMTCRTSRWNQNTNAKRARLGL